MTSAERQAVVEQAVREFYKQWVNTERSTGPYPKVAFAADFALSREGEREKELRGELKKHLSLADEETLVGGIRNLAQVALTNEGLAEAAEARVKELERQLGQSHLLVLTATVKELAARTKIGKAEAERDRLRGALKTYGTHKKDCHVFWKPDEDQGYTFPCSCGFEAALNPAPEGVE